nr:MULTISPECIES: PEPxxWA-CTERM sorting domain-containing protein [Sphingomonas]
MSNQLVVSFAAAAMAAIPAQAAINPEQGHKVAGAAFGTLSDSGPAQLKLYDAKGGFHGALQPFGDLKGGVWVAAGDVNGDGRADIVAGHASGPLVNVYDGASHTKFLSFEPFGADFKGGINVASGFITDSHGGAEIVTGAGPGGGPHVRVFDGQLKVTHDFNAFDPAFQGGVRVAAGDVTGDGVAELIVGTGPGGGELKFYDGTSGRNIGAFDPFGSDFKGGLFFTAGKYQGRDSLFVSKATEGDGSVFVFDLANIDQKISFNPFGADYKGGVTLGFTTDGTSNTLIVGEAEGGRAGFIDLTGRAAGLADAFDANPPMSDIFFTPFGPDYHGGISVAGLGAVAVPEPATWAMMLTGFGAAGLAMRRRRLRPERHEANAA